MQIKKLLRSLRRTPLHPQWLLGNPHTLAPWVTAHANGVVLDVGCADRWVEKYLSTNTHYLGVDYWETGKHLYRARPDIYADAACLPVASSSCDCVVLLEVLEHVRAPAATLREAARVLTPGGSLLLSIPFLYPIHDAPHDYQRLTRHGVLRDLEEAGLETVSLERRLGAVETATLLACLALGGSAMEAIRQRHPSALLMPLFALSIPLLNLMGWCAARLLPDWPAMTSGFKVLARKPVLPSQENGGA